MGGRQVTLLASEAWPALIASGVHASPALLTRHIVGSGGARVRAVERVSGARVHVDRSRAAVTLRGAPDAIARARAALDAIVSPAATIDVAAQWGALVARGVHPSPAACVRQLMGVGASRLHAVERASGAMVWSSADSARVFIVGEPPAIRRARSGLDRLLVPAATIDIGARWGGLIADGVFASPGAVAGQILGGPAAEGLRALEAASGAVVWVARDNSRVFVAGEPAACKRAYAALDAAVVPAAVIDAGKRWGRLIAAGVHASPAAAVGNLIGPGSARLHAIARGAGAVVWAARDGGRLFVCGDAAAVDAAAAAMDRVVVPTDTIDVEDAWGLMLVQGAHASREALVGHLVGPAGATLRGVERASGAVVWLSGDCARVFLSGDRDAVGRARAALDAIVAEPPARRGAGGGGA